VLDFEGVNFVDSQGAAKLAEIHGLTHADGVTLRLSRLKPQVLAGGHYSRSGCTLPGKPLPRGPHSVDR